MKISSNNLKKIIVVVIVLGLIILIGITSNPNSNITGVENAVETPVSYIQKFFYNIGQTVKNAINSVQDISKVNKQNAILTKKIYQLKEENRILKNIVNSNKILQAEYELKSNIKYDYVLGQVIAKDDSNWFSRITIDKGSKDGLKKNDIVIQAVETEEGLVKVGLVGVVSKVGINFSKIITIIDESCKVSFKDIENNQSGIISGNTNGEITGFFFDSKTVAKVGDEIFTSGIGKIYLDDIYIGKITSIEDTTDASSKKIHVESVIDFTKIYKVFVIKVNR